MHWLLYLLAALVMEVLAVVLAPALPLFASLRPGPWNNGKQIAFGHRLPGWLAWFDTPDNALDGDENWLTSHAPGHWSQVGWLWRNRAYGFKWGPLAAPMYLPARVIRGDLKVNRNNGHYGLLRISMGKYWQWKYVTPIASTGWCLMLNFGWLLDDDSQPRALFLFSPRVCKITAK